MNSILSFSKKLNFSNFPCFPSFKQFESWKTSMTESQEAVLPCCDCTEQYRIEMQKQGRCTVENVSEDIQ